MPQIPRTEQLLTQGARLCDIGCGKGLLTPLLASEYETSSFVGYNIHAPLIDEANMEG